MCPLEGISLQDVPTDATLGRERDKHRLTWFVTSLDTPEHRLPAQKEEKPMTYDLKQESVSSPHAVVSLDAQAAEEQSSHEISKHEVWANLLLTSRNAAANNFTRLKGTLFFADKYRCWLQQCQRVNNISSNADRLLSRSSYFLTRSQTPKEKRASNKNHKQFPVSTIFLVHLPSSSSSQRLFLSQKIRSAKSCKNDIDLILFVTRKFCCFNSRLPNAVHRGINPPSTPEQ